MKALSKLTAPTKAFQQLRHVCGQIPQRSMLLHEYQAAQLMHKYMIPIPLGQVAFSGEEAFKVARSFGIDFAPRRFVIKAQVKCDGRTGGYFKENGFHGGIQTANTIEEVRDISKRMLGKKYINDATSDDGFVVNCVYI